MSGGSKKNTDKANNKLPQNSFGCSCIGFPVKATKRGTLEKAHPYVSKKPSSESSNRPEPMSFWGYDKVLSAPLVDI